MIRNLIFRQQLRGFNKIHLQSLFNSQHPVFKQSTQLPENFDISDEHIVVDSSPRKKDEALKEKKSWLTKKDIVDIFVKNHAYKEEDAIYLIKQNKNTWKLKLESLNKAIAFLSSKKISGKSVRENPWLLGADLSIKLQKTQTDPTMKVVILISENLENKIMLCNRLEPRDINDFVPLLKLSTVALYRIEKSIKRDKSLFPEGSIIYYFSQRLGLDPSIVSKHFAEHLFIFETDFHQIEENLNVMIDYDILPIHIITDLWAFRYDPKKARPRFEICREAGKTNLKPWMIRCSPKVLNQMLALSRDRKNVLGENTIVEYLSERLKIDDTKMKKLMERYPAVTKIRVSKVKKGKN